MLVLDCSVTMAWCFADEASDYADQVLTCLETQSAIVPPLWHLEVTNILLVGERRGRITSEEIQTFLDLLAALDIQTDHVGNSIHSPEVFAIGREYGLSAYDAAYMALAMRERLPLATADKKLRTVAEALGLYFVG